MSEILEIWDALSSSMLTVFRNPSRRWLTPATRPVISLIFLSAFSATARFAEEISEMDAECDVNRAGGRVASCDIEKICVDKVPWVVEPSRAHFTRTPMLAAPMAACALMLRAQ